MKSDLQRKIMRRVYYSYTLSILASTVFWQGFFLGGATLLLADWLHVASIVHNFLAVPVGYVPYYFVQAFSGAIEQGEFMTVLVFVGAVGVAVSVGYHLAKSLTPRLWIVRQF